MSIFDLELPRKDLDQLEDRLRLRLGQLPDVSRKSYYDTLKPQLRDPDTYVVLCWFLGFGLHHFYLRKWWAFLLGVLTGLSVYGGIVAWISTGALAFPVLFLSSLLYSLIDTCYNLVLSQRVVQHFNIKLGWTTLAHTALHGNGEDDFPSICQEPIERYNRKLLFISIAAVVTIGLLVWWMFFHKECNRSDPPGWQGSTIL